MVELFGLRLKELREAAGLTQGALGELAGMSQRAISHYEQGLQEPGWGAVIALADALGVEVGAFLVKPKKKPAAGRGRPRKG